MPDLDFNLSHDGPEAVLAVARGSALGIDMTALDRAEAVLRISRRFFSDAERREIEGLREENALGALKLWALKESIVKAGGNTVWQGLSDVSLSIADGRIVWKSTPPGSVEADWNLALGYHRERYLLALAQRTEPATPGQQVVHPEIQCRVLGIEMGEEEGFHPDLRSGTLQR